MLSRITKFWNNSILHVMMLGNPFCSDDSFAYHLYQKIKDVEKSGNLRVYFSYSINVEELLMDLSSDTSNCKVLILDTIHQPLIEYDENYMDNIIFSDNFEIQPNDTHKAEWGIISKFCHNQKIPLAKVLIPVNNVEFTAEIGVLPNKLKSLILQFDNYFSS